MIRRRAPLVLGAAGLVLLAAGAVRVVAVSNGAGLVALMVVGAVLLVSPFVISRVERLSLSTAGFELRLSREIAELGAPHAARILDRTDLARLAESYAFVHKELGGSAYEGARVHLQDVLVQRAAAFAREEKFEPAEVRALFGGASPAMRVLAIGLMKGDPSLADGATILAAIADPRSANEQYQGLELAKLCWKQISESYRSAIQSVVKNSSDIEPGSDRRAVADEILALPVAGPNPS